MKKDNQNFALFSDKETPVSVSVELKKPLTVEETVKKHLLRKQYMENLEQVAQKMGAGQEIDDEFHSDEEAFTAAESEYIKSQEDFRLKKEKYFKANQEKIASEMATKQQKHKEFVAAEAKKLGLLVPKQPKASVSAQASVTEEDEV